MAGTRSSHGSKDKPPKQSTEDPTPKRTPVKFYKSSDKIVQEVRVFPKGLKVPSLEKPQADH